MWFRDLELVKVLSPLNVPIVVIYNGTELNKIYIDSSDTRNSKSLDICVYKNCILKNFFPSDGSY